MRGGGSNERSRSVGPRARWAAASRTIGRMSPGGTAGVSAVTARGARAEPHRPALPGALVVDPTAEEAEHERDERSRAGDQLSRLPSSGERRALMEMQLGPLRALQAVARLGSFRAPPASCGARSRPSACRWGSARTGSARGSAPAPPSACAARHRRVRGDRGAPALAEPGADRRRRAGAWRVAGCAPRCRTRSGSCAGATRRRRRRCRRAGRARRRPAWPRTSAPSLTLTAQSVRVIRHL